MVKGDLVTALDWRKKTGDPCGQYSYRTGNVWSVVQYGPGFSNTFLVTEHDDAGLQWLQQIERREESGAQDRAVRP